jgi:diguanylate cyclase (GGDEF)-like protein
MSNATPIIFVVDDDPAVIHLMGRTLAPMADIRFATNGADATRLIREIHPDLVLLDAQLGDMSGLEVMEQLRTDPLLVDTPVIFVTSHHEEALEVEVLEHGAADFLTKPVRPATLIARVRTQLKVRQLTAELRRFATQDALTGVANRRAFDEQCAKACRQAQRTGAPISLLMMDVDAFKAYNDLYGHQAGDEVLHQIGGVLQHLSQRPQDLPARYGGEEFALLLPETDLTGALHIAGVMLTRIRGLRIPHADSPTGPFVTVSLGAAQLHPVKEPSAAVTELIELADRSLYAAKHAGRNQVCALKPSD